MLCCISNGFSNAQEKWYLGFLGAHVCNRVPCAIKAINCLSDVPTVHQNLLFNYEECEAGCSKDQFLISSDTCCIMNRKRSCSQMEHLIPVLK